jgi:hypothetical protein
MDLTCCSVTFFQRTMEYLRLQNETTISRQMWHGCCVWQEVYAMLEGSSRPKTFATGSRSSLQRT